MQYTPDDLANFIKVSSMVLSTALKAPGTRERATAISPFSKRVLAPGRFLKSKTTALQRKNSTPLLWGIPDFRQTNRKLGGNIGDSKSTFIQDSENVGKKYIFWVLVNARCYQTRVCSEYYGYYFLIS